MAVTHLDLLYRTQTSFVSSQRGLLLMVFSLLCGFSSFVLCLAAEATRSEVTWLVLSSEPSGSTDECYYSGSGKTPLTCAVVAFFALAVAMFTEHAFILITMNSPTPPALVAWAVADDHPESPPPPPSASALAWQACVLFLATWICFAVAEVLLMVGIGVESGHLTSWRKPRPNCIAVREGLFAAAGVFGLTTVFLAAGLYLTALRAQRLQQRREEEEEGGAGARRRRHPNSSTNQRQEDHVHGPQQNQQSSQGNQPSSTPNNKTSA